MINVKFEDGINDLTTENLYQWDTFQTLQISGIDFGGVTPNVHFANKKSTVALVVSGIFMDDGSVKVSIPNSLLTEKYDILAYVYTSTGLTGKTIKSITIPVISRLKPSEYTQPTDEDIAKIEELELEAKVIIDGLTASEYSNTETYKRPNIVYYNFNSYMCISNVEISGILPTDTTKWQKIAQGSVITGISKNEYGDLIINCSDGSTFTLDITTTDVTTVGADEMPALGITRDNNGALKIGDTIIPQKVLLYNRHHTPYYQGDTINVSGLKMTDTIEIEYMLSTTDMKSRVIGAKSFYLNDGFNQALLGMTEDGKINVTSLTITTDSSANYLRIYKIYKIIE